MKVVISRIDFDWVYEEYLKSGVVSYFSYVTSMVRLFFDHKLKHRFHNRYYLFLHYFLNVNFWLK